MICGICKEQESKYKCPKCSVTYCSIKCYKSPEHSHDNITESTTTGTTTRTIKQLQRSLFQRYNLMIDMVNY